MKMGLNFSRLVLLLTIVHSRAVPVLELARRMSTIYITRWTTSTSWPPTTTTSIALIPTSIFVIVTFNPYSSEQKISTTLNTAPQSTSFYTVISTSTSTQALATKDPLTQSFTPSGTYIEVYTTVSFTRSVSLSGGGEYVSAYVATLSTQVFSVYPSLTSSVPSAVSTTSAPVSTSVSSLSSTTTSTSSSSTTAPVADGVGHGSHSSAGGIAGGVVAGGSILAALASFLYWYTRHKRSKKQPARPQISLPLKSLGLPPVPEPPKPSSPKPPPRPPRPASLTESTLGGMRYGYSTTLRSSPTSSNTSPPPRPPRPASLTESTLGGLTYESPRSGPAWSRTPIPENEQQTLRNPDETYHTQQFQPRVIRSTSSVYSQQADVGSWPTDSVRDTSTSYTHDDSSYIPSYYQSQGTNSSPDSNPHSKRDDWRYTDVTVNTLASEADEVIDPFLRELNRRKAQDTLEGKV